MQGEAENASQLIFDNKGSDVALQGKISSTDRDNNTVTFQGAGSHEVSDDMRNLSITHNAGVLKLADDKHLGADTSDNSNILHMNGGTLDLRNGAASDIALHQFKQSGIFQEAIEYLANNLDETAWFDLLLSLESAQLEGVYKAPQIRKLLEDDRVKNKHANGVHRYLNQRILRDFYWTGHGGKVDAQKAYALSQDLHTLEQSVIGIDRLDMNNIIFIYLYDFWINSNTGQELDKWLGTPINHFSAANFIEKFPSYRLIQAIQQSQLQGKTRDDYQLKDSEEERNNQLKSLYAEGQLDAMYMYMMACLYSPQSINNPSYRLKLLLEFEKISDSLTFRTFILDILFWGDQQTHNHKKYLDLLLKTLELDKDEYAFRVRHLYGLDYDLFLKRFLQKPTLERKSLNLVFEHFYHYVAAANALNDSEKNCERGIEVLKQLDQFSVCLVAYKACILLERCYRLGIGVNQDMKQSKIYQSKSNEILKNNSSDDNSARIELYESIVPVRK